MELADLFEQRRTERLAKDWSAYQPNNPIASDLHDCDRYQAMRLVAWKVRQVPDVRGMEVMEDGVVLERAMIAQLLLEGWELVEQQAPFEVLQPPEPGGRKRKILTGRMDGKVVIPGEGKRRLIPIEFKSTSEWNLDALETEEDLKERSVWTRKWWRQLQAYMLGGNCEKALLVLGFRGRRRVIEVSLDYDEAERILVVASRAVALFDSAQAESIDEQTIDAWLNAQTGAPGYHADPRTCRLCPFYQRACFPIDVPQDVAQVRVDLEPAVARLLEAKPFASDYEKLRKLIKEETTGFAQTVAGPYVIDGHEVTRKSKAQPAKEAKVSSYWSFEVRGAAGDGEEAS